MQHIKTRENESDFSAAEKKIELEATTKLWESCSLRYIFFWERKENFIFSPVMNLWNTCLSPFSIFLFLRCIIPKCKQMGIHPKQVN